MTDTNPYTKANSRIAAKLVRLAGILHRDICTTLHVCSLGTDTRRPLALHRATNAELERRIDAELRSHR